MAARCAALLDDGERCPAVVPATDPPVLYSAYLRLCSACSALLATRDLTVVDDGRASTADELPILVGLARGTKAESRRA